MTFCCHVHAGSFGVLSSNILVFPLDGQFRVDSFIFVARPTRSRANGEAPGTVNANCKANFVTERTKSGISRPSLVWMRSSFISSFNLIINQCVGAAPNADDLLWFFSGSLSGWARLSGWLQNLLAPLHSAS